MIRPAIVAAALALAASGVRLLHRTPPLHAPVVAVAFSPDGRHLVAADHGGGIEIRRSDDPDHPFRRFTLGDDNLNTLSFSPDGRRLAAAGRSIHILDSYRAATVRERVLPRAAIYGTARYSPDGQLLATVNAAEEIELWRTSDGLRVRSMCCMALYGDLAFSPDGKLLASAGHWPAIWDVASGARVRRLVETREPTFGPVAFSPDGQLLATGSQDGRARLWDVATGRELQSSGPRPSYVESVAFHPDGALLADRLRDGSVSLWDTRSRSERRIALAATSNVAFSPDGRWLAFAASGGRLVRHRIDIFGRSG